MTEPTCLAPPKWRGSDGRCNSCLACDPRSLPLRYRDASPAVQEIMSYSDPLLDIVTFHDGRDGVGWHDGPGWYYTINDYPDEGSVGAFKTCSAAMEHAEEATRE